MNFFEEVWFVVSDFWENWIYPGYHLKNLLFYRYDLVRVDCVKPYEYGEVADIMFSANMKLIENFLERQQPEKNVSWYKTDDYEGIIYGENDETYPIMYEDRKGMYVMDIIKQIYHWYKQELPRLEKDYGVMLEYFSDNVIGEIDFEGGEQDENGLVHFQFDRKNCPQSIQELKQRGYNEQVVNRYIPDEKDLLDKQKVEKALRGLLSQIYRQKQMYLHLCVQVRPYLLV